MTTIHENLDSRVKFMIEMLEYIRDHAGELNEDDAADVYVSLYGCTDEISRVKSHVYWTTQEPSA